jgi:hypothetical protein
MAAKMSLNEEKHKVEQGLLFNFHAPPPIPFTRNYPATPFGNISLSNVPG